MITDPKVLGERLQLLRKKLDLTQQQVSDDLNITRNKLSRSESGDSVSLDDFLLQADYYEKKLHPITFNILAVDFQLFDNTAPAINQVAIERLALLNTNMTKEINAISEQLKVMPIF